MQIKSTLPRGSHKTNLDTSPPLILLSLYCKQINKVKNELDGQLSSLIVRMHASNYTATFSPMHLVFFELDTHLPHLDENNSMKTTAKLFQGHFISNY